MLNKVIVAGHICMDITPIFPAAAASSQIKEILVPGSLIKVGAADLHSGGSVANTGLGLKLLGADARLMGKIGTDDFGKVIAGILEQYGAAEGLIRDAKSATSYSIVLAIPGIDRIFLHNPGANDTFTCEDIPVSALKDAVWFHFGYPTLMRKMYADNGEELLKLFQRVKEQGLSTSLDMAAVNPNSEAAQADWKLILSRVLPYVDFFLPSIEELGFMLDRSLYEKWKERADGQDITSILSIEEDVIPLADRLLEMGTGVVMIKCGARGLYYRTSDKRNLERTGSRLRLELDSWSGKEGFEVSFLPDRVLSATGAGDTCIAAFIAAVLRGDAPESCVRLAAAEGACCVESYDAISSLKTLEELEKKIQSGWKKNGNHPSVL